MSQDTEMDLAYAADMAQKLLERLAPACERIEIAGSVRRKKPHPGDIEIVCKPGIYNGPDTQFCDKNHLEIVCDILLYEGTLEKRPDKIGRTAWGEKAKRGVFYQGKNWAPVDIFSVTGDAQWGVIYAIRTGPGDFNRLLVTDKRFGGACPENLKVAGGQVWYLPQNDYQLSAMPSSKFIKIAEANGARTKAIESEEQFFDVMGIPYWEPQERTAKRLREYVRQM